MNEQITFPDEYRLTQTKSYYHAPRDPEAVEYCRARNALLEQAKNGKLYVKFVSGDRAGSIARVQINLDDHPWNEQKAEIVRRRSYWHNDPVTYEIERGFFFGVAKWDKRKNSCKLDFPSREIVFLPNYEGPTVYEMFDRKAAREELLKNPDQHDIDGKLLEVGDKVLYINARYGSGFQMCHGTIKEFKANVDSSGHSFTTVVQNDEGEEVSSITSPSEMIWKK